MTIPIIITLTNPINSPGPFDLYSDSNSFGSPFETGILLTQLENGYITNAPDGSTIIRVQSTGGCNIYKDHIISNIPTPTPTITPTETLTPTPTETPTPTPTPTITPTPVTCIGYTISVFGGGSANLTYTDCNGLLQENQLISDGGTICTDGSPVTILNGTLGPGSDCFV